jgi:acetyltransferase-like isoleucine patch superfamily enzyme
MFWSRGVLDTKKEGRIPEKVNNDCCMPGEMVNLLNSVIKNSIREYYTKINKRYPALGNIFRRICYNRPVDITTKAISGSGNIISYKNSILTSVVFHIKGDRNYIQIAEGSLLEGVTFSIRGDDHTILIGRNCSFGPGSSMYLEDCRGVITIGENSTFGQVHIASTEPGSKIEIGSDCMFANDIDIRTGDSHAIVSASTGERLNYAQDVMIGNHVWVAAHCVLLKGVHISDDSIVATGSVVTKKFNEKHIIIAGNPAIVVKEEINWTRQRTSAG